jgi:tetratricopeptide (TPR) repeat protein
MYQIVLYDMGFHLFDHGELEDSLFYIEKGISYSLKIYNMWKLPDLILMKYKILCSLKEYEKAKEYYNYTLYIYKITENETALAELESSAKADYPELFKE